MGEASHLPAQAPPQPRLWGVRPHPRASETAACAHLYRGCSEVSDGDRSGMERDVEDRVVAMEAVVASSKEGGVQGRRSGRPAGTRRWAPLGARPQGCPAAPAVTHTLFFPHKGLQQLPKALKTPNRRPAVLPVPSPHSAPATGASSLSLLRPGPARCGPRALAQAAPASLGAIPRPPCLESWTLDATRDLPGHQAQPHPAAGDTKGLSPPGGRLLDQLSP